MAEQTGLMNSLEYEKWWNQQFPCRCGHQSERHYLAPQNEECRACADCHGNIGAMNTYIEALMMVEDG